MKKMGNERKKITAFVIALVVFIFMSSFGILFTNAKIEVFEEAEMLEITWKHYELVDDINDYINQNISLIKGFSAYIQMNEEYHNDDVYTLLRILLSDRLDSVRNVTVFKDTTINWVYPLEGNEQAIGVDLSQNPEQAKDVMRVKNNLETLFVGPINLVQGGVGFIIRMPLLKDNEFWGMVSVVLRAEYAFSFIEEHSNSNEISYFVTHHGDQKKIIYGDEKILHQSPLMFESSTTITNWDMYVVPKDGWTRYDKWSFVLYLLLLSLCGYISKRVYLWVLNYNRVLDDKTELENKIYTDSFTGISNRRYFDSRIIEEIAQSDRQIFQLSLIYFDLDKFKEINDTYGHAFGDVVLSAVAKEVETIIRAGDIFARWGGDEFIILLPFTDVKDAIKVAEKVRLTINSIKFDGNIEVTTSIGVSERLPKEDWPTWFRRTDLALYESKNSGRNKVTVSE